MKKYISPFTAAIATALSLSHFINPAGAAEFLFDFGSNETPTLMDVAPNDPANTWNNIDASIGANNAGILSDLRTVDGNVITGMGFQMLRRFNGANQVGYAGSAAFPENASRDSLFGNTEIFGGLTNVFPAFKLTGLDAALSYSFTFYASRTGVGDTRETQYTVTGAAMGVVLLNASDNVTDATVSVEDISPNGAGEIMIELGPGAANDNGNHFTYLNVLRVETATAAGDIEITSGPDDLTVTEFDPAVFSVSVSGGGPFMVQWFQDDAEIPGANGFTYTIPETSLDLDGAVFTVTVSNAGSSETSVGATLSVEADSVRPEPLSATTSDGNSISVKFSEPLDASSATTAANYAISSESGASGVSSATLSADRTEVVLVLASPAAGAFTLTITGVTDRAGNAVDPAANTIDGVAPVAGTSVYLFDFGGGTLPSDPQNTWNLVSNDIGNNDAGVLTDIVNTRNEPSTIAIEMVRRFNATNTNGFTTSALYPADASGDSLYGNTEVWNALTDVFPAFKLTGLNPNLAYTLNFYASRMGVGDNRETEFTITGGEGETVVNFDPANNDTDRTISVDAVIPSLDNEITVALAPGANNNNTSHFTYLGVLRVDAAPSQRAPFAITSLTFDRSTNTVDLTFNGLSGVAYSLQGSDDLQLWLEIDDSITSTGEGSSVEFVDLDAVGKTKRFYRLQTIE